VSAAIVTGGSAGIGRAVVQALLERDYEVISLDLQTSADSHKRLKHVKVDLTDNAATARIAADIAKSNSVTTLIHNAGTIRPAPLPEVKLEDLEALVIYTCRRRCCCCKQHYRQ
jgi:3-oxoacyl-[acyl-carrier protein] reductase